MFRKKQQPYALLLTIGIICIICICIITVITVIAEAATGRFMPKGKAGLDLNNPTP